jgi:hypothetical protein
VVRERPSADLESVRGRRPVCRVGCPPAMSADGRTRSARRPGRTRAGTPTPHGTVATRAPPAPLDTTRTALKLASIEERLSAVKLPRKPSNPVTPTRRRVTNCVTTDAHTSTSQRTPADTGSPLNCGDAPGWVLVGLLRDEVVVVLPNQALENSSAPPPAARAGPTIPAFSRRQQRPRTLTRQEPRFAVSWESQRPALRTSRFPLSQHRLQTRTC